MAKAPSSNKPPGHHVGGRGRGRKMAIGPGPDLPTPAEIAEFRRRLREFDAKGEAELELDRIVERYEAWRARQLEELDIAFREERAELARQQERLSEREQAQVRSERKFDRE
ncbi:MAG: hypothetical protein QOI80_2920, partial [Solirubrobacteraceae bacterium]|nr:hypothetical protein [Solirubrobacteraceae bacterium]